MDDQLLVYYESPTINLSWNDSVAAGSSPAANITNIADEDKDCVLASRFYIQTILSGVLCITGIVTNGFSIAVLSRDRETSQISSLLLRSLAFADIFFLSSWIIAWTLPSAVNYSAHWIYSHNAYHYLRIYSYPLLFIGQMGTIWTTVLIAASRFIAVSLPYHAPTFCTLRGTRIRLAVVVVFSIVYNIPRFFEMQVLPGPLNPGQRPWNKTAFGSSYGFRTVYFDICYYVVSFFLPLVLLTTFNVRLIVDYRRINRKRGAMLSSGRTSGREKHEQNITLIMIIVIVVFVLCNTPAKILQAATSSYARQPCPSNLFFLLEFSTIFEVLNSNLNFFVYFIFRKQFRQILQRELCATTTQTTATVTQLQQTQVAPPSAAPNGHTELHHDPCYKSITKA